MFFERIKGHLQYEYKLVPHTTQFNKMLRENIDWKEDFIDQLYRSYEDDGDDDDQEEEDEEPAPKKSKIWGRITGRYLCRGQGKKKDAKVPEKTIKKVALPKSLSKGIRLRGVFTKVTPSKHKKEKVFPKKLPITKDFRTKHQLKENEFQYYYTTSVDLLVG